jgi:hypothetical protein
VHCFASVGFDRPNRRYGNFAFVGRLSKEKQDDDLFQCILKNDKRLKIWAFYGFCGRLKPDVLAQARSDGIPETGVSNHFTLH